MMLYEVKINDDDYSAYEKLMAAIDAINEESYIYNPIEIREVWK